MLSIVGMAIVVVFFIIIWASIVFEVFREREQLFGPHQ